MDKFVTRRCLDDGDLQILDVLDGETSGGEVSVKPIRFGVAKNSWSIQIDWRQRHVFLADASRQCQVWDSSWFRPDCRYTCK
jgi:hypothetical protein